MEMKLRVNTKAKKETSIKEDDENIVLEPLSPQSENYLQSEESGIYIIAVFESEIPIDETAVYAFLQRHYVTIGPHFSSIVIEDKKGKKTWKRVELKIKNHVKIPFFPPHLSPKEYNQHFDDYLSKIANEKISHDQPLWECHIIKYPTSPSVSGTLILKFHHAIGDGVSLMGSLYSSFSRADNKSLPLTFPSAKSRGKGDHVSNNIFCIVPKFLAWTFSSLYDFGQGIGRILFEDDRSPIRSGNQNVGRNLFRYRTISFSINEVKKIKKNLGMTVNEVVVGTIILGTQLYMQEVNPRLRRFRSTVNIPVNIRSTKGYAQSHEMLKDTTEVPWGNKTDVIQISIPNFDQETLANPLKVVMHASKDIKRQMNSFGHFLLNKLFGIIGTYGGPKASARIFDRLIKNVSLAITNMIGPLDQMSFASHPITGFYFLLAGVKMSLTVTVMSYMQNLRIVLGVEADFINQDRLTECMQSAFQLILQAATVTSHQPTK